MSTTSLSFWTPIQHYSIFPESNNPPVKLAAFYCQDMIEAYFSCGGQVATPTAAGNREVVLIDPPSRNIICEIFLKIIVGLSYLTVIIPAIMLIAKCILRCGVSYQIQQEQPLQNTQEVDLEMQSNQTVPTQGDEQPSETQHHESEDVDEGIVVGTLDRGNGTLENESEVDEESLDASEEAEEEEAISSTLLNILRTVPRDRNSLASYYLVTDQSETAKLQGWFDDTETPRLSERIKYLFENSKITSVAAWNMLLECTAMFLNDEEIKNHPLFRTIYEASTKFLHGGGNYNCPIRQLLESHSFLISTPPYSFLIAHHSILTSYQWQSRSCYNRCHLPGLLSYFPIPLQGEKADQIIWEMDEEQKFFNFDNGVDTWFFFQESGVSYIYDYNKTSPLTQKLRNTFAGKLQRVFDSTVDDNIKRIYELCVRTRDTYQPQFEVYAASPT